MRRGETHIRRATPATLADYACQDSRNGTRLSRAVPLGRAENAWPPSESFAEGWLGPACRGWMGAAARRSNALSTHPRGPAVAPRAADAVERRRSSAADRSLALTPCSRLVAGFRRAVVCSGYVLVQFWFGFFGWGCFCSGCFGSGSSRSSGFAYIQSVGSQGAHGAAV